MKSKEGWWPDTMSNSGGKYNSTEVAYIAWINMMRRCYNPDDRAFRWYGKNGITVNTKWHEYQDYAEWYYENYPLEIEDGHLIYKLDERNRRWVLDKDILKPGNREYGPDACTFTTQRLNMLFSVNSVKKHSDLPLGVAMNLNSFQAMCNDGKGKQIRKTFRCLPDAVDHYWSLKFRFVLAACEEVSDYDEELGEQVMTYFYWFKKQHYPDL